MKTSRNFCNRERLMMVMFGSLMQQSTKGTLRMARRRVEKDENQESKKSQKEVEKIV